MVTLLTPPKHRGRSCQRERPLSHTLYPMTEDLISIHERLATIETKLDILVEGQQGIPARVAVLERAMWWVKGVAAISAAVGGFLLNRMGII